MHLMSAELVLLATSSSTNKQDKQINHHHHKPQQQIAYGDERAVHFSECDSVHGLGTIRVSSRSLNKRNICKLLNLATCALLPVRESWNADTHEAPAAGLYLPLPLKSEAGPHFLGMSTHTVLAQPSNWMDARTRRSRQSPHDAAAAAAYCH
jgi:hypothetical protein